MIQVIERSFRILEELALDGEVSLENLARTMSLNKGTLCNILRTLVSLGYVVKTSRGCYAVSEGFRNLCAGINWDVNVLNICRGCSQELSEELGESVVISTIRDRRVSIISQAQFQRNLMINQVVYYARLSLYHSVSGRIVLAFLPANALRRLFQLCEAPGEQWDGITSFAGLQTATEEIRRQRLSVMTNYNDGIKSFAVPVFDGQGDICVSLALTMPISRLASDGGEALVQRLHAKADELSRLFQQNGIVSRDLLHPIS